MTEVHTFEDAITCHAFSADRTQLALAMKSAEVRIYRFVGNVWNQEQAVTEHTQRVSAIDWAPKSNRILTCAADRNANVWTFDEKERVWKPVLVILRIDRAAICCKWSPDENKFAVGSGQKLLAICYYDADNNWWSSRHIKKSIRSTVTSLDWHPNNQLIACGATDFRARIFSAFLKEVDRGGQIEHSWGTGADLKAAKGGDEDAAPPTKPGKGAAFGNPIAEFANNSGGWVHSVQFSPDGSLLAWLSHDSTISIADSSRQKAVITIRSPLLPFTKCLWTAEDSLVATGHDYYPVVYKYNKASGELRCSGRLLTQKSQDRGPGKTTAMDIFKKKDARAENVATSGPDDKTPHNNLITEISSHTQSGSKCLKISTVGLDGRLAIWDLGQCTEAPI